MKKQKRHYSLPIVISRKCDVPMADKKGFLPCEGGVKCSKCAACLEQTDNGEWRHYWYRSEE